MEQQYMTLRELSAQIGSTKGQAKPTPKYLRDNDGVVDVYTADDYQITVYRSGFAVAWSDGHQTVIRADRCGSYTYDFDNSFLKPGDTDATEHSFDAEYFMELQWPIRLVMEADDQFQKNEENRERGWLSKHPEIPDDKNWMTGGYYSFEEALIHRMEMEEALATMTDKQRRVFLLYQKYGYTQQEIGKMIGISQAAVNKHLRAAYTRVTKNTDI